MDDFVLTARQRRRLREELMRCRDARVYRRVLTLLEVDAGRPVAVVARSLGVTRQSVHNWLRAFQKQPKLESLHNQPRSGRPPTISEEIGLELQTLLEESPREHGYLANTWTVPLLLEHLRSAHDRRCGENTLRRKLHRLGYTWTRSRYVLSPDVEEEKKTADSPLFAAFGAP